MIKIEVNVKEALEILSTKRQRVVVNRVVKRLATSARTAVQRELADRLSVRKKDVKHIGMAPISREKPGVAILQGALRSMNLSLFKPKQDGSGVHYTILGEGRFIKSAFMIPKYKNRVFIRSGNPRFPLLLPETINKGDTYSTSIGKLMVRPEIMKVMESSVEGNAQKVLDQELTYELGKVFKL